MAYTLTPNVTLPYNQGTQFTPNNSDGVVNYQSGGITMDGTTPVAVTIPVGFSPRKVVLFDVTGVAKIELMDQLPAGDTIKTATNGAITIDTTGLITVGTEVAGTARQVIISASALTASHSYVYEAWA